MTTTNLPRTHLPAAGPSRRRSRWQSRRPALVPAPAAQCVTVFGAGSQRVPADCDRCAVCPCRSRQVLAALLPVGLLTGAVLLAGLFALLFAVDAGAQPAAGEPVMVFDRELRVDDEQELRWPVAVASGAEGEVAVADVHGARLVLWRHAADGWGITRAITLPAPPVGLAWDGGRYVVAVRATPGLLAAEGENLALRPIPLPEGGVAGAIAGDPAGGLWVHDVANHRVLRLDGQGRVASQVAVEGEVTALAAGAGGGFFTGVGPAGILRRHAAGGGVEETWTMPSLAPVPAWPAALAVTPGGEVVAVDRHSARILVFAGDGQVDGYGGREGWEPGLLRFPAGIALLPDGRVVVADLGNGRVQIFRWLRGAS